ncbi:branched-chain amino acid ABC transporter ATP-binding protein/permease [Bradyrhizobium sp. ARR65]|uniref:branched-chain amino acid ABC transporter ATP-binding protein/permease n=1 Tax=Bradyrhizobium sp. ARR65 TaxID=1040989 RepID=UPI00046476C8|nr:branched-chain amino acid ABC transporter ATP-binding protein/permease [Bradyrhizobium sp. ARR65]
MARIPAGIAIGAALVAAFAFRAESYTLFVIALIGLNVVVMVGLNILFGLTGQVSLGHVGFYAIGAYVSGVLALKGVNFFAALPLAILVTGALGALLALPALRVSGPYLAMVTIAFAFIVEHGLIEWRDVTGGANGLIGILAPSLGGFSFAEREMALLSTAAAALSLLGFWLLSRSSLGASMRAVRDSEVAAQSIGLNPVSVKALAFAFSAALTGMAGAIFAPLLSFISPGSFPFFQSILFLFGVVLGGAGSLFGPVLGAAVVVWLPEMLSDFAEYRLLIFGLLLLGVLWLAPDGVVGLFARFRRPVARPVRVPETDQQAQLDTQLRPSRALPLRVDNIGIAFGGVIAAANVTFQAIPGAVTSLIGPNGAGKSTVLNIISGFYAPDTGTIRLGEGDDLAGAAAYRVARSGVARTYQTTQLFGSLSVMDNVRLGGADADSAEALLAFVGYAGGWTVRANDLPHVDRRLVEIARALATRPRVLLLDEPAAGLMRADKDALGRLLRRIADLGIAVILVEHDMTMVMGISDHIVVLDAGKPIAAGTPSQVRDNPAVIAAYLGGAQSRARGRSAPLKGPRDAVLSALRLTAGYGAAPVLTDVELEVCPGELVALLGANGAGKSTAMKALSGLLRPVSGDIVLKNVQVAHLPTHRIAHLGLALVPEGRQVFPELTVRDNILLGATARPDRPSAETLQKELDALLARFPRLIDRIASRAGLLSGGEQQMLAIARGLMAKPDILLLDEPSLGLAPAMIAETFDVLVELRDAGVTILLVDQLATLALTVADRGYVLESGRVVKHGTAAELSGDADLEAAYLGAKAAR